MSKSSKKTHRSSRTIRMPDVRTEFDILITTRCNFGCSFCFINEMMKDPTIRQGPKDMRMSDFRKLTDKLAKAKATNICIGGGEPFLHPQAIKMVQYAAKSLGPDNVEVSSNMSFFPKDPRAAKKLWNDLHGVWFNMSIDREHLRFDKSLPIRIKSALYAADGSKKLNMICVARNSYEKRHPLPRNIAHMIPAELRRRSRQRRDLLLKNQGDLKSRYLTILFMPNGRVLEVPVELSPLFRPMLGDWRKDPLEKFLERGVEPHYHALSSLPNIR